MIVNYVVFHDIHVFYIIILKYKIIKILLMNKFVLYLIHVREYFQ